MTFGAWRTNHDKKFEFKSSGDCDSTPCMLLFVISSDKEVPKDLRQMCYFENVDTNTGFYLFFLISLEKTTKA